MFRVPPPIETDHHKGHSAETCEFLPWQSFPDLPALIILLPLLLPLLVPLLPILIALVMPAPRRPFQVICSLRQDRRFCSEGCCLRLQASPHHRGTPWRPAAITHGAPSLPHYLRHFCHFFESFPRRVYGLTRRTVKLGRHRGDNSHYGQASCELCANPTRQIRLMEHPAHQN